jgi:tetratricopeptide (TPR) repeat protein
MSLPTDATSRRDDRDHDESAPGGRCGRYVVRGPLGAGAMGTVLAAYDPTLNRNVALKLLHARSDLPASEAAARIAQEAQAMARLAHPNVVAVFEVDRVGDQTFVAMELVEGLTLRAWIAQRPRSWREIVDMFIAAGRGLAAAHAAGLVHRDFKPDNVLIGRDRRPRVSDFGLVRDLAEGADALPDLAPQGVDVTARGTASGTPAYMSPEQWAGQRVDARGDQFAFCVALWEALYGRRPFSGSTVPELRAAVQAGALVDTPRGPRVPHRLHAALRRGLAVDPAARWPDMPALLDVLARVLAARRRWRIVAVASLTAIASAAVAAALSLRPEPDPCPVPVARLDAVWSPLRRAAVGARLAAVDPVEGANRFSKIASALDLGALGWSAMHVEACRATRIEARQSDTMLDRRMGCLEHWLGELGDTVAVIEQAGDRAAVDHATQAATGLSPLAACADLRALAQAPPLPTDIAGRAAAIALGRRAQELDVDQRARKLDGLPAKVRDLVAAARTLDHAPTLVAALAVKARVDLAIGSPIDAELALRELTRVAPRARDDRAEAFAWTSLIATLGTKLGKADEAVTLFPVAAAAVLRAGDPPDLRAELLYSEAGVLDIGPHPAQGLELLTQARALLDRAGATLPGSPLAGTLADVMYETGLSHARIGDDAPAEASFRDAVERWRAIYGGDSPDEAFGWQSIGALAQRANKKDEALAAFRTTARIREARLGESPNLAFTLVAIASVQNDQAHWTEALATYDRALRIDRAQLPPGDPQLSRILIGRAITLNHLGRLDEAAQCYDDALALYERAGVKSADVAVAFYNRGKLHEKRGRCTDALRDHARAATLYEELRGPNATPLLYPLVGGAICLIHSGHAATAIPRLERALGLPAKPSDAFQVAVARAYLGRARVETRRDVAGGLAMIKAARSTLATDDEGLRVLRELDRWLATRK